MVDDILFLFAQGEWVWVKSPSQDVYAGKIVRTDKEKTLILDDDNQEQWISNNQVIHRLLLYGVFQIDNNFNLTYFFFERY